MLIVTFVFSLLFRRQHPASTCCNMFFFKVSTYHEHDVNMPHPTHQRNMNMTLTCPTPPHPTHQRTMNMTLTCPAPPHPSTYHENDVSMPHPTPPHPTHQRNMNMTLTCPTPPHPSTYHEHDVNMPHPTPPLAETWGPEGIYIYIYIYILSLFEREPQLGLYGRKTVLLYVLQFTWFGTHSSQASQVSVVCKNLFCWSVLLSCSDPFKSLFGWLNHIFFLVKSAVLLVRLDHHLDFHFNIQFI